MEASERASRASIRASVASRALQRLRQAQTPPSQDSGASVRRQGTDVEYQAKLWTDEDGFQLEVSTLAQADSNAKDSVLARRLCDEIAARTPLGIQSVKLDPSVVHAALTATAAGVKERSYDLSSSSSLTTTPREDGLMTLTSLPWFSEGPKGKKFLTLLGQNSWYEASSPDSLRVMDCGKVGEDPEACIRKLGYILVGVYGSHCARMMSPLLGAVSESQVNTRRSAGYIFARADGLMRNLWHVLRNFRKSSPSDLPLCRGGWHDLWAESVRAVQWTDAAEERWRLANPTLPLEPHLSRVASPGRIPKRKPDDESGKTPPLTSSSTLTATPDAPRRPDGDSKRARGASSSERRPCLPTAANDLGVKKHDGSSFSCGSACTFDHTWKTIEPRVLSRFFSETAIKKLRQFRDEKVAAARLAELVRPYLK